jgi:hypothetical protein
MGRVKEKPRYNVVSMRVTDEEKELIQKMINPSCRSIGAVLRLAFETFCNNIPKP